MSQRTRIQNRIIEVAEAGVFHPVVYDPNTGAASVFEGTRVRPSTVLVNETQSVFGPDTQDGRARTRIRNEWSFQLILAFDREVSLEEFEDSLIDDPPRIDANDKYPQVILDLERTTPAHPPQQNANTGTEATMLFRAYLGRS